jgi:hypothetical protein
LNSAVGYKVIHVEKLIVAYDISMINVLHPSSILASSTREFACLFSTLAVVRNDFSYTLNVSGMHINNGSCPVASGKQG